MTAAVPPVPSSRRADRWQQWAGAASLVPGLFLVVNGIFFWAGLCLRLERSTEACFVAPAPGFAGTLLGLGVLFLVLGVALLGLPTRAAELGEGSAAEPPLGAVSGPDRGALPSPRGWMVATAVLVALVVIVAYLFLPLVALPWLAPHRATCTCAPVVLDLSDVNSSHPAPGVYYAQVEIAAYPDLSTAWFGVEITNFSGAPVPAGSAPETCASPFGSFSTGFDVSTCGAPTGAWYVVLVAANGTVENVFASGDAWLGTAVAVTSSTDLYVVSGTNYTAPPAILSVYGIDGEVVAGSVYL